MRVLIRADIYVQGENTNNFQMHETVAMVTWAKEGSSAGTQGKAGCGKGNFHPTPVHYFGVLNNVNAYPMKKIKLNFNWTVLSMNYLKINISTS